jgi:hypothetical protein
VRFVTALLVAGSLLVAACEDEADDAPSAAPTSRPTSAATTQPSPEQPADDGSAVAEVQGIVGAVDEAQRTIEINQIQGAEVDVIELSTATRIRDAQGRVIDLAEIRPSDRVVARGRVEGDVLIASEVTVSQAVPGSGPGG